MEDDLPRLDVPRPLVAGTQDLSSTLSHLYGRQCRQSTADETLISKLETSLPARPDPLHADYVSQLTQLRDTYVTTQSNIKEVEEHMLEARAIRLAEKNADPCEGSLQLPPLHVLQQNKLLTSLDSSLLRKYNLLVPEDFCVPPKPVVEPPPKKRSVQKKRSKPQSSSGSQTRLETILPTLLRPSARGGLPPSSDDCSALVIRAEPATVRLDSFQVDTTYELSLRVTNVSCSLLWVRLQPPATPQFQLTSIRFPGTHCTLAPGLALEMRLSFRARRRREVRDRLLVATPLGQLTVPLVASHAPPVLRVDARVEMGEALVGCRKRRAVTVTNEGGHGQFCVLRRAALPAAAPEGDPAAAAADRGASIAVSPDRFALERGQSIALTVSYLPTAAGDHVETLVLVCDNGQVRPVTVRGRGVRGVAGLVSVAGDFHEPRVGERADKYCEHFLRLPDTLPGLESRATVRLHNTSGVPLAFRWQPRCVAVDIYGADAADVRGAGDTRVTPARGALGPQQHADVTFACVTREPGERRVVWSLLLERMPGSALRPGDVRFAPGGPRPELASRIGRQSGPRRPRRTASLSCLVTSEKLDIHAPAGSARVRSGSVPPPAPPVWSALSLELQTSCRCDALPLWLEPPLLRLPESVPFWGRVSRSLELVNDAACAVPFAWETVRRGDLLVSVSPEKGEVPARGRRTLSVTLWSARELHMSAELKCVSRQFGRTLRLPVIASFLGPEVTVSDSWLALPRTRVGDRSERSITIGNPSKLPLAWRTARAVERGEQQPAQRPWRFAPDADPFSVTPSSGLLHPDEEARITIAFEPRAPAAYDMALDISVSGSSQSRSVCVRAESCHLSLALTPAFTHLDAYVGGTVTLMVFVTSTCDLEVPFRWEVPQSDSVLAEIEPVQSALLPWATLVSELRLTGLRPGPYGYYCLRCWVAGDFESADSATLTLYGDVHALAASVHIAPNWGLRPAGAADLGECREVLGRSRREALEREAREAAEEAARALEPPPEPEPAPSPPPTAKGKKGAKKPAKAPKKGKKKGGKAEEPPPEPPVEPEPEPEPVPPEPEPEPEVTVDELVSQWEPVDAEDAGCGPLVLLFGHNVDVQSVVIRELHVTNNTPIEIHCTARVLTFPGHRQEKWPGDPPSSVQVRRVNKLEREDVWSELLSDNRGVAFLARPDSFTVRAHGQTTVRVFCCADMWGEYADQLVISGENIPDLVVDLRVGVTGSPVLVVNTGSNHVRFGCQLYGAPPVERHVCLNNVSPCPIQLDMAVALTTPVGPPLPPPFRAHLALGADFEPLLPTWEWRVLDDTPRLDLRPVLGQEDQAYYTVSPRTVVVPARGRAWILVELSPVRLPAAASRWERRRRQTPMDVLAWLTAHMSLRSQDRRRAGVARVDGYGRAPLRVQLRAQLRTAYLRASYPEPVALCLRPAPVLAGPEDAVRMVAPVAALAAGPRRARLASRITLHNPHQVDVEAACWTTPPFALVRAESQRGAVDIPQRCLVPHNGHTQLSVEFRFSPALLRFCLTQRLERPTVVRVSPQGDAERVLQPDAPQAGERCPMPGGRCEGEEEEGEAAPLATASEPAASVAGSDGPRPGRPVRSEPVLPTAAGCPTESLQDVLCGRAEELAAELRAAEHCLREVEVSELTTEHGERRVRFASRIALRYADAHVQAFPVEAVLSVPALRVAPASLPIGAVMVGDAVRRGLYVSNPTVAPLRWTARLICELPIPAAGSRRVGSHGPLRRPERAAFQLAPELGVLAPLGRTHLTLTFSPASAALYAATIELSCPCLLEPVTVPVTGEGTYDEKPHVPGA